MEGRRFGTTERATSVIGQGTWDLDTRSRADAIRVLRRGLDLGMRHVDTAKLYGAALVRVPHAEARLLGMEAIGGGPPYGASTIAGDGSPQPRRQ
jgi:aryl-alcohol dehydrogenase-like predicted oxidoreductase